MKLPPQSNLTDKKFQEIKDLIDKLGIRLSDIEEKFICGGGRGGQKINKSTSAVQLKYSPTGILIKYQKHRERAINRILALRDLLDKLNPNSKKDLRSDKIRKQKRRRQKKRLVKSEGK